MRFYRGTHSYYCGVDLHARTMYLCLADHQGYIYRVALTNDRLERFQHGRVTFRYTHARTHQSKRMTLPVDRFIARFLQHVLPSGFTKVRSYGLLCPSKRTALERARQLLNLHAAHSSSPSNSVQPENVPPEENAAEPACAGASITVTISSTLRCSVCQHGHLHFLQRFRPARAPP
jgi:hypothetical protein